MTAIVEDFAAIRAVAQVKADDSRLEMMFREWIKASGRVDELCARDPESHTFRDALQRPVDIEREIAKTPTHTVVGFAIKAFLAWHQNDVGAPDDADLLESTKDDAVRLLTKVGFDARLSEITP